MGPIKVKKLRAGAQLPTYGTEFSANQRLINVPASLKTGEVVLWEDWQGEGRGLK